jgi:DNA-binding PadR family transcriptional regulator
MTPVFGHGRLRLYLLKLIDEEPRHGYDVIRLLEDRFMGTYAPSAGTIYPRLSRLEAEGLVTHSIEEGKKVYRLTDQGRAELRARAAELAELEADIKRSVHDLASEIRDEVHGSIRDIREELKHAARDIRRQQRHGNRQRRQDAMDELRGVKEELREAKQELKEEIRGAWEDAARGWHSDLRDAVRGVGGPGRLERALDEFRDRVRATAGRRRLSEEELRDCQAALDEAYESIAKVLRRGGA